MSATISLTVNGRPETLSVEGAESLAAALRRELQLFGVREACGIGVCGSCTILVEDAPVSACLILAGLADGLDLTTVEGLAIDGALDPLQQAFVDHTAFQCSYCTPGFLLAARALLAAEPSPTREQTVEALSGNLCRCGSYTKILDAVADAAGRLAR